MKIHFIAIGGAAMHNIAIALHKKGYTVSGSDDEIFDPSKSRLEKYGLLPDAWGWFPKKINSSLDAIILGMHARKDNPELLKAQELGLKIFSFPEYLYQQTKNKKRLVIGGSHGKTTITSMVMHVLKCCNVKFDYMVGSMIEGFETMAGFDEEAKIAIFEGDEYLSSPIDRRPKFHLYQPDVGLISGIAWDHINVFPTFENYVEQFSIFAQMIPQEGALIYFEGDKNLQQIAANVKNTRAIAYSTPNYRIENNTCILETQNGDIPLKIIGEHNLQNLNGARLICKEAGVSDEDFYSAIKEFTGAAKRMQLLKQTNNCNVYLDFAHSPSKLKATINGVKEFFPQRKLIACMELHTFSSLSKEFLQQYKSSMDKADIPIVYYNEHTIAHKKLEPITHDQVFKAFGNDKIKVYTDSKALQQDLLNMNWDQANLLLMSSGNFDGIDFKAFADDIIARS